MASIKKTIQGNPGAIAAREDNGRPLRGSCWKTEKGNGKSPAPNAPHSFQVGEKTDRLGIDTRTKKTPAGCGCIELNCDAG